MLIPAGFRTPLLAVLFAANVVGQPFQLSRCEIIPLPGQQVSFRIHGEEKLRWHFDAGYTRPFFHPFRGPSGAGLTRIGHPGAQNHDHHRSVWFAHHDVNGFDFWSENGGTKIRQKLWYAYRDGEEEAVMASLLGWFDPQGGEVMEADLVTALRPLRTGEHLVEIQLTLRPAKKAEKVELGKTNFGVIAVRVAKTMTVHFGGGQIVDSRGRLGEAEIFGKAARWMDYSGPVASGTGPGRKAVIEGITLFDHPGNPNFPAKWHVREDGWMGPSLCRDADVIVTAEAPLVLRYLLHAHAGPVDPVAAGRIEQAFHERPGFAVGKSQERHRQFDVWRVKP
jgi:hypothetical protein